MLRVGDVFERYTIEARLGEGGMGQVFVAFDRRLQRRVALKVVTPSPADDAAQGSDRILREARAAAALDHPNVVAIFDVGELVSVPYIAMELVEGKPLRAFVGDARVPIERRLRFLLDVARALDAAHRRGLVHRDVKPENVMVRDDHVVKVLDFGIARRKRVPIDPTASTESPVAIPSVTREGQLVGTPLYMAPEQMRGEPIDSAADQFAWGVMAYELLAGRHPWDPKGDLLQLAAQICSQEPPSLRSLAPHVPEDVARIVARAMSKVPAERFASMADVIDALEPFTARSSGAGATDRSPDPPFGPRRVAEAHVLRDARTGPTGTVPEGRAPAPRRLRSVASAVAVLVATVAVALVAVRARRSDRVEAPAPSKAPASASNEATRSVLDLPMPTALLPETVASYKAALQAYRDGKWRETITGFERAAKSNPGFAAAHLRAAALSLLHDPWAPSAKKHLHEAIALRSGLDPEDAALLDAIEPLFRGPPALDAAKARFERAVAAHPKAIELRLFFAHVLSELGELDAADAQLDAALRIDPLFGTAWNLRGVVLEHQGRTKDALAAWDQCISAAPSATACLRSREGALERAGECARAEADLRTLIAHDETERGYRYRLAKVLYALGHPRESVELALAQYESRGAPKQKLAYTRMQLALLFGDFAAADAHRKELAAVVAPSTDEAEQAVAFQAQLLFAEEKGQTHEAATLAERYLKQRAAWSPMEDRLTLEPLAWNALRKAKRIDEGAFVKLRDGWLAADAAAVQKGGLSRHHPFYAWLVARASTAETEAEATSALAAMPAPPPPIWDLDWKLSLGRTYALGNKPKEALPALEALTRSCQALDDAIVHTLGFAWLARALESTGDTQAACTAWSVVVRRFGAAPQSSTAGLARARLAALSCAK